MIEMRREFIHGKKFDEQWSALGLNDDDLKDLQRILLENPKIGSVIQGTGRLRKMENLSKAERNSIKQLIERLEKYFEER